MNHKVRAKGIIGRTFPKRLFVRDKRRTMAVDVTSWHAELEKAVAKGLHQVERDAKRIAFVEALTVVGQLKAKEPATDVAAFRRAAFQDAETKLHHLLGAL